MPLSNLFELLQQYENPAAASAADTEKDFDQVSQNASQSHIAGSLAQAFRSNQTPPFAEMLTTLFNNSNGQQRAGILNQLLGSAGGGSLSGIFGDLLGGGSQVTPEQAQKVPPEAVHQLAAQAEKNNPSIVDMASNFYAQHPGVIKALGAGSLAFIMSHMAHRI